MPRYRQVWNEEEQKSEFIEIGAKRPSEGMAVHGDIDSFVSPIDGSVISDRKQYREHMRKHGVVPAAEFSQEFYDRKAKERARLFTGEHTREEKLARKREINEIINHLERR